MILVAVLAVGLGLGVNHLREHERAIAEVWALGGQPSYKHWEGPSVPAGTNLFDLDPPGPRWLPRRVRQDLFADVTRIQFGPKPFTDEQLSRVNLRRLAPEILEFRDVPITDAALAQIGELQGLEELYLVNARITDAGLAHLENLPKLKVLWLPGTQVTDRGMASIRRMKSIESLVVPSSVSDQAIQELERSLPNCQVNR